MVRYTEDRFESRWRNQSIEHRRHVHEPYEMPQWLLQLRRRRLANRNSNRFARLDLREKIKNLHLEREIGHVRSILNNLESMNKDYPNGVPPEKRASATLVSNRFRFWSYCEGDTNRPRVFDDYIVMNLENTPTEQKRPIIKKIMKTIACCNRNERYVSQVLMRATR